VIEERSKRVAREVFICGGDISELSKIRTMRALAPIWIKELRDTRWSVRTWMLDAFSQEELSGKVGVKRCCPDPGHLWCEVFSKDREKSKSCEEIIVASRPASLKLK
jgi:hypothetical protein